MKKIFFLILLTAQYFNLSAQVPKIYVSYHLMYDSGSVSQQLLHLDNIKLIIREHDKLNKAFNGICNFEILKISIMYSTQTVLSLYEDYSLKGGNVLSNITGNHNIENSINVYIAKSGETISGYSLLGFTTNTIDINWYYNKADAENDVICLSYDSIIKYPSANTIIHEMGHFYGLKHPFLSEMKIEDLEKMQLTDPEIICVNYMNYNCYTNSWTLAQEKYMSNYIKKYRKYLFN